MTAIVWDLMTGDEVARFASYENLTCAAWMRNGNVAFGMLFGIGTIKIGNRLTLRRQFSGKHHIV